MVEKTVLLGKISDVKEFVKTVSEYGCDVDLISGKYIVDAKSIMGIFSLDLSKPILMRADCAEGDPLLADIDKFIFTAD
ncbi:MAG TPA: serine kinase [Ruminococcaceae bacterium]|nr:serine kinase [Oscillospiraceae bacterium]